MKYLDGIEADRVAAGVLVVNADRWIGRRIYNEEHKVEDRPASFPAKWRTKEAEGGRVTIHRPRYKSAGRA